MSKRLTIVLVLLCAVLTSARAGYKYKVYTKDGGWTDWIYADENNRLTNLIKGDKVKEDASDKEWSFSDVTKIERMAFMGLEDNQYKILDNDDYEVFKGFKDHLKELDLEDWQNTSWDYSFYFMNMTALEKVKLPNHDISMGGEGGLFSGCVNLKEVEFGTNTRITAMSQRTFESVKACR